MNKEDWKKYKTYYPDKSNEDMIEHINGNMNITIRWLKNNVYNHKVIIKRLIDSDVKYVHLNYLEVRIAMRENDNNMFDEINRNPYEIDLHSVLEKEWMSNENIIFE